MRNLKRQWIKKRRKYISIAPEGPQLYRPKEQYYNMFFEFNPFDDDNFPSVPHGDAYNHHYKLDLKTGDVWEGRRRIVGHLKKKEFDRLKRDARLREIVASAQEYYREHHPTTAFDPIPWAACLAQKKRFYGYKSKTVVYRLKVVFEM